MWVKNSERRQYLFFPSFLLSMSYDFDVDILSLFMFNSKIALIVTVIGFLALAGCSNAEQSAIQTSPDVSPASQTTATSTEETGSQSLLSVVNNTKSAVESGDFAKAKTEFDKFEDSWKPGDEGIKGKSPKNYKAIEDSMDKIEGELKASQPSKEKVLPELQSLEKTIAAVEKP